jgi:hypothetical protein
VPRIAFGLDLEEARFAGASLVRSREHSRHESERNN